jgi:hypothetical protein
MNNWVNQMNVLFVNKNVWLVRMVNKKKKILNEKKKKK